MSNCIEVGQKPTNVVELLIAGRTRIDAAWAHFDGTQSDEDYCAISAIANASVGVPYDIYKQGCSVLRSALPDTSVDIYNYNDASTTTKEDILALYDRAISLG